MIRRHRTALAAATVMTLAGLVCATPSAGAAPLGTAASAVSDNVTVGGKSYTRAELTKIAQPKDRAGLNKLFDVAGLTGSNRAQLNKALGMVSDAQLEKVLANPRTPPCCTSGRCCRF